MNVDLLKYGSDTNTTHHVDTMFSLGLYPLIDKPTRITAYSATLIDNIFTNELDSTISSGLLINYISDQLPTFAICKYKDVQRTQSPKFRLIRKTSDSCIAALKDDLLSSNWDNVTNEENVNVAYSLFIERLQSSYEKCCPVKKVRVDENDACIKPWFTKGLRNACRKKNCLYKKFLQNRTDTAEIKYKAYKNKLTSVLRNCEQNYYIKLLEPEKTT